MKILAIIICIVLSGCTNNAVLDYNLLGLRIGDEKEKVLETLSAPEKNISHPTSLQEFLKIGYTH